MRADRFEKALTRVRHKAARSASRFGRSAAPPVAGMVLAIAALLSITGASPRKAGVSRIHAPYDIVYVRMPRPSGYEWTFPDFSAPVLYVPGTQLRRLRTDGTDEVFYDPGPTGAAFDPCISFDARWVFFSVAPDVTGLNPYNLPYAGADVYKKNVQTGQVIRLTDQLWIPPSGAANWSTSPTHADPPGTLYPGYGILNLGPCPMPGGKVVFVSNRDTYRTPKGGTNVNLRLYTMDEDGENVEKIGHLNIGSALHPFVQTDGRINFSTLESHASRGSISWGNWAIHPDGRQWEPLMSAFQGASGLHFQGQRSDGKVVTAEYYIRNDGGFGTVIAYDPRPQPGQPIHGSPFLDHPSNPAVRRGIWFFDPSHPAHLEPRYTVYQFSPPGLFALSAFSHAEDNGASYETDGTLAGKVTHPSGVPGNQVLVTWSPGHVNARDHSSDIPDAGIYLIPSGNGITTSRDLILVKNDPSYNEIQAKPLVPYSAIYGVTEPLTLAYLPNDGSVHPALQSGTPFGLIGTSSFYNRETSPAIGGHASYTSTDAFGRTITLDSFNTLLNGESSNWFFQGADAGKYTNSDIWAVRILAQEGVADLGYGAPGGFMNHAGAERLRILGEIPLRKAPGVLDPDGNPDTSFLAKIPADTPFTFQTLDRDGLVLNMAQTWHQLRPGEMRADCGGCHAHSRQPTNFFQTAAAQPGYVVPDLTTTTPLLSKDGSGNPTTRLGSKDVEYYRDIKPILERSCVSCHNTSSAAAQLVLNDHAIVDGVENTYNRLARNNGWNGSQHGIPPIIEYGGARLWRGSNASRYVRIFQSRRSLLMWKIMGRRLDGWTNADHPTESVPGNPATLPPGAAPSDADIDYLGTIMPPPGTAPALTADEKMTFARWIDLGCPINFNGANPGPGDYGGWFSDELKPTLTVSSPRPGALVSPLTQIRIGMWDSYSGLNRSSLSVVTNFTVNGNPPYTELGPLFTETPAGSGIFVLILSTPITSIAPGRLTARVWDSRGNVSVVHRRFGGTVLPPVAAASFYTLPPCRLVDTRDPNGPHGGPALVGGSSRTFPLTSRCGVPPTAKALSLNVTATQADALGNLRLYAGGTFAPLASSINYRAGQTRANNAIGALGTAGTLAVFADQATGNIHLILDVNGYFQ